MSRKRKATPEPSAPLDFPMCMRLGAAELRERAERLAADGNLTGSAECFESATAADLAASRLERRRMIK